MRDLTEILEQRGVGEGPGARRPSQARPALERWSVRPPRHLVLAALALALAIFTAVMIASPGLRLGVVAPTVREPLAIAITMISLFACALGYVWFSLTGARSTLLIALAFLLGGLNQFMFSVVLGPSRLETLARAHVSYFFSAGRLATALLLLAAARARWRPSHPVRRPLVVFALSAVGAVAALGVVQWLLFLGRNHLPAAGLPTVMHPDQLFVGLLGAALLLMAAYLFRSGDETDQPPRGEWLSLVLVLAAFSHLNYALAPALVRHEFSQGDLLRAAQFVALFGGLVWEIRVLLMRQDRERRAAMISMSAMRDEVSRIVTHDLVHSIATLRAFSFSLSNRWGSLDEEKRRSAASTIEGQSARLGELVEETVAALSLAPDQMKISMEVSPAIDLVKRAAAAVDRMDGRIQMRVGTGGADALVLVDANAILRVLTNLLWNAQQYSAKEAPVQIVLSATARAVLIEIKDQGPGIPRRELNRLFSRSNRGMGRSPGSGMGLYLSTAIVEAHGGQLWAKSRVGEGSTFALSLPRESHPGPWTER